MVKEQIGIYQDPKNKKTTIVIYNMTQKTRDKIALMLLGDLKVEEISGLEEVPHDTSCISDDLTGMEPVTLQEQPYPAAPSMFDMVPEMDMAMPAKEMEPVPTNDAAPVQEPVVPEASAVPADFMPAPEPPEAEPEPVEEKPAKPEKKTRKTTKKTTKKTEAAAVVEAPVEAAEAPTESAATPTMEDVPAAETTAVEVTESPFVKETPAEAPAVAEETPAEIPAAVEEPVPAMEVPAEQPAPIEEAVDLTRAMNPPEEEAPVVPEEPPVVIEEPAPVAEPPEDPPIPEPEMIPENREMPEELDPPEPQDYFNTDVYADAPVSHEKEAVLALWQEYNEAQPFPLLKKFINILYTGTQDEKVTAAEEAGKLLVMAASNRRRLQSLFWYCKNVEPFADAIKSVIRQKGYGDGLVTGTPEYDSAMVNTLNSLSDGDLMTLAKGTGRRLIGMLEPMFNIY